jgi:hypothetical protein
MVVPALGRQVAFAGAAAVVVRVSVVKVAAGGPAAAADCQPARVIRDTVPGESARNVAIVGVSSKVT